MVRISTVGAQATTNAAAVATALAGGITTAEVQALGDLLSTLAKRPDLLEPVLLISATAKNNINLG